MGFGLLFVGHVCLFFCKGIDVFPDVLAYALIFWSMWKLSRYAEGFKRAKYTLMPLMALAAINDAFQISAALGYDLAAARNVFGIVTSAGMLVMYWFILDGIKQLATEVGRGELALKSRRNKVLTVIYVLLMAVYHLQLDILTDVYRYLGIIFLLFGLAWTILNGVLFFSCYMWICLEGDEDMPEDGGFMRFLPKKHKNPEDEAMSLESKAPAADNAAKAPEKPKKRGK